MVIFGDLCYVGPFLSALSLCTVTVFRAFPRFLGFVGIVWGTPAIPEADLGAYLAIVGPFLGHNKTLPLFTETPEPPKIQCVAVRHCVTICIIDTRLGWGGHWDGSTACFMKPWECATPRHFLGGKVSPPPPKIQWGTPLPPLPISLIFFVDAPLGAPLPTELSSRRHAQRSQRPGPTIWQPFIMGGATYKAF